MELSKSEYEALQEMYEFKAQMEEERILRKWKKQGLEEGRKQGIDEGRKLGLDEGHKQGLEEGHKQGLEQGRAEEKAKQKSMILAMNKKFSIEEIASILEIEIEEVKQILK